jgi:hypothetical protein
MDYIDDYKSDVEVNRELDLSSVSSDSEEIIKIENPC